MKTIFSLISIIFFFNSCAFKSSERFSLKAENVKTAFIKEGLNNLPIELSKAQSIALINELNNSKSIGPTKYMKKYWIQFRLKNDSLITIGCNNSVFSINSAFAYKTSDKFFDNYWNKIESEKQLNEHKSIDR
jgi:hypothetical protein